MSCLTNTQINQLLYNIDNACGCDCGDGVQNNTTVQNQGTMNVYYGRSANPALNATGVVLLTMLRKTNFAGTYNFGTVIGTYCYVAYPSSFGIPAAIIDPLTGFEFDMEDAYTITILGLPYRVYKSANILNGAAEAQFIQ